jgi:hypothetical protein
MADFDSLAAGEWAKAGGKLFRTGHPRLPDHVVVAFLDLTDKPFPGTQHLVEGERLAPSTGVQFSARTLDRHVVLLAPLIHEDNSVTLIDPRYHGMRLTGCLCPAGTTLIRMALTRHQALRMKGG